MLSMRCIVILWRQSLAYPPALHTNEPQRFDNLASILRTAVPAAGWMAASLIAWGTIVIKQYSGILGTQFGDTVQYYEARQTTLSKRTVMKEQASH